MKKKKSEPPEQPAELQWVFVPESWVPSDRVIAALARVLRSIRDRRETKASGPSSADAVDPEGGSNEPR